MIAFMRCLSDRPYFQFNDLWASVAATLLFAVGAFFLAGAWFDWDWLMNSPKTRFFLCVFGRGSARFFYGTLGFCLLAAAVVTELNWSIIEFVEYWRVRQMVAGS